MLMGPGGLLGDKYLVFDESLAFRGFQWGGFSIFIGLTGLPGAFLR